MALLRICLYHLLYLWFGAHTSMQMSIPPCMGLVGTAESSHVQLQISATWPDHGWFCV